MRGPAKGERRLGGRGLEVDWAVLGDVGAALPDCGEGEVEAFPVRSREKGKEREGAAVPAVRGQVRRGSARYLARARGRTRPWEPLQRQFPSLCFS